MDTRAYFVGTAADLLARSSRDVAAELARRIGRAYVGDERLQIASWERELDLLQQALGAIGHGARHWGVLLELPMLRLGRRLDAVLLIHDLVVVLEFKIGATSIAGADIEQVEDYAFCLRDFHEASREARIIPVLVPELAKTRAEQISVTDGVAPTVVTNADRLTSTLRALLASADTRVQADPSAFDQARYNPTPNIIDAAKALYAGHSVQEIGRSDASGEAIAAASTRLHEIARSAEAEAKRIICFVTGTPGAGKTLLGLNLFLKRASCWPTAPPPCSPAIRRWCT